jgi:LysM repeat protein
MGMDEGEDLDMIEDDLDDALEEASAAVQGEPPDDGSPVRTVVSLVTLAVAVLFGGGGLFLGYTARQTADKALERMWESEKSADEAHEAVKKLREELKSLADVEFRRLHDRVENAAAASRTQFATLQGQIGKIQKTITPPPRPRVVEQPRPTPSTPRRTPPAAQPAPAAPRAPSSNARVYVIKSGDTLGEVAKKQGISVDAIKKLNPGVDPRRLKIGQEIRLR